MYKHLLSALSIVSISFFSMAQSKVENADCTSAIDISLNTEYKIPASNGAGKRIEISSKKPSKTAFFKEHHTYWYQFKAPVSGELLLEITPDKPEDDIDWIIYRNIDTSFCSSLVANKAVAVRSNIARNDLKLQGKTGMTDSAINEFEPPGVHSNFSKVLLIEKDAHYFFVIDNIQQKGKGFTFKFTFKPKKVAPPAEKKVKIKGTIIDSVSKQPLCARVIVELQNGNREVSKTYSDSASGKYELELFPSKYMFIVEKDGFFQKIDYTDYNEYKGQEVNKDFVLDSIRVGGRISYFNINFEPNKSIIKKESEKELFRLYKFLKDNPNVIVDIRGHTNSNNIADQYFLQRLSFRRAEAVKDYLIIQGITANRLSFKGLGSSEPLVVSDDFNIAKKNSRVEIVVINLLN
jgi:outer membrane protein OmpA-like peptidoglycan-associated protein